MSENNCKVLGTSCEDADYIKQVTPLETKRKELADDPSRKSPAINAAREKAVDKARRGGNVRPLDGSQD